MSKILKIVWGKIKTGIHLLIGWFIVVIEALVSAPLWVLGIARVDGGEGFLGQSGRDGLFLFLSVLTRPFGMLFGLCIAMTVMTFVDKLLIGLFSLFVVDTASNTDNFEIPFISMFVYLFILSATRTTFVHKIFGLISYLPDVMVGWIGARGQHLSDDKDEEKVSGIVSRSAGHLALASQSAQNGLGHLAQSRAQKNSAKQAAQREQREEARHQETIGALKQQGTNNAQGGTNIAQGGTNIAQGGTNIAQGGTNIAQGGANQTASKGGKGDTL